VVGDGLDGHVGEEVEGVAFEGVGESAEGLGEADRGLPDEAAVAAPEAWHGQAEVDGLAAEGTVRKVRSTVPWRMTLSDRQAEQRSCSGSCSTSMVMTRSSRLVRTTR